MGYHEKEDDLNIIVEAIDRHGRLDYGITAGHGSNTMKINFMDSISII